jgi:hypothetical protein
VNGAGKTTASRSLLANTLKVMTFVSEDVIAQGLSGFDPSAEAFAPGESCSNDFTNWPPSASTLLSKQRLPAVVMRDGSMNFESLGIKYTCFTFG